MAKNTGNLYLQLSANTDTYVRALKAAKASTQDFAGDVDAQISGVQAAFDKLGGTNVTATARAMEASFRSSFANIRASAEQALTLPRTEAGALSINLTGAAQAQADAERVALAMREIADAAAKVVIGNDSASEAEKRNAISAEANAQAAEARVGAIREEVAALRSLQVALEAEGASAVEAADSNDEMARGHRRLGNSGLLAEHAVRSFADSVTAGQSPVRAFALEIPRVTEAIQFLAMETNASEGALGRFASFMAGGWGLALTIGVSLLAPLVAKLAEGSDASDDMKGKTLSLVDALEQEKFGTDAARKALEDYNAEKKKARDEDSLSTAAALAEARARLQAAIAIREEAKAQAEKQLTTRNYDPNGGVQGQVGAARGYESEVSDQTARIADLRQGIRNLEIDAAKEAAKAAADPIEAIRQKYKQMADAATDAAAKNDKLAASLKGTLSGYAIEEAAEIKAAEAKRAAERRTTNDDRQFGRTISLDDAEGIVRGIGGRVTSAQRSTAEQAELYARYQAGTGSLAAKPGTSLHERGQALDVAKGPGISLATLKEAFAAQGVRLTEALDEGDHYHVGFGPKGPKGPSADTLARRQQAATTKAANNDRAYIGQDREADDAISRARAELANTIEARYQVQLDQLRSDLAARQGALQDEVTAGKLTQAQADSLKAKAAEAEQDEEILLDRKKQGDLIAQQLQREQLQIDGSKALLETASSLATTTQQRKDIALQILALDEQRLRNEQAAILANPNSTPDQKTAANSQLAQIDLEHAGRVSQIGQQNASPLQAYALQLHKSTDDMGEALEGAGVSALTNFGNALEGIASHTTTVSQAIRSMTSSILADLVKLAEQKLFSSLFSSVLGGLGGGLGASVSATSSSLTSSLAASNAAGFQTISDTTFGHHANGGFITGPGGPRSDSIPTMLSNGEFVMNASSTSKYLPVLHAMNDNRVPHFADGGLVGSLSVPTMRDISRGEIQQVARQQAVEQHFHITNSFVEQKLWDQVHGIAQQHVTAAAPKIAAGGAQMADSNARRAQRRQLS